MSQNNTLNTADLMLKGIIVSLAEGGSDYNTETRNTLAGNEKRKMIKEITNHLSRYGDKYTAEPLISKALQGLYPLRKEIIIKLIEEELQPGQYGKFCELRDYIRASFKKLRLQDADFDLDLGNDGRARAIEHKSEIRTSLESKLLENIPNETTMHNVINSCNNIDDFIMCADYCVNNYTYSIPLGMLCNKIYTILGQLDSHKTSKSRRYAMYMNKLADIALSAIKKYNYNKTEVNSELTILLDYGSYTYGEKYRCGPDDFDIAYTTVTSTFRQQVKEYFASKQ